MIAEVIVDIALSETDKIFDYALTDELDVGRRVLVPFGSKQIEGFIIGLKDSTDYPEKIKNVIAPLDDFTAVTPEMIALMREFSESRHLRYIDMLRLCLPAGLRGGQIKPATAEYARLTGDADTFLDTISLRAKQQRAAVSYLKEHGEVRKPELTKAFGNSAVNALIDCGYIEISTVERRRTPKSADTKNLSRPTLNADQQHAVDEIISGKGTFLLHGVTGSGKTEVYMHCIEEMLSRGKSAIMLVPEISLTPQVFSLFRNRFGDRVAILHSGLSQGERFDEWRRLRNGEACVAVGARSAIFAPVENVGVIIIDEEHDGSYVSEGNPRYDTVDVAEFRAKYNDCPVILGSATPSIGSYYKAEQGEYKLLELPKRINNLLLPEMEIVNMSAELRLGNRDVFSAALKDALKNTVEKCEQAIIFLNRRGYASFIMCKDCGYIPKCRDCDISLTYHREDNQLKCHYCGRRYEMIDRCPVCGSTNIRQGRIGTERVVAEVKKLLPEARILRMDNDTTNEKGAHQRILNEFSEGKADVLVGTQMIAKGHDFQNVTLVGILDADFSLYLSDYRSNERTFQLITQVAGRAGRAGKSGKVIIQTYTPRHYVFRYAAAYDYKNFYLKEKNTREVTKFPPFTNIVRILVTSLSDKKAMDTARGINDRMKDVIAKYKEDFVYYKGAKAPITRIQNKYRYQLLMRVKPVRYEEIKREIFKITDCYKGKDLWVFTELDPQTLI